MPRARTPLLLPVLIVALQGLGIGPQALDARQVHPQPQIVLEGLEGFLSDEVTVTARVTTPGVSIQRVWFYLDLELVCERNQPPFSCQMDVGQTAVERTFSVWVDLTDGTRASASVQKRVMAADLTSAAQAVSMSVRILDRDGNFVPGLAESIRVFDDGAPQDVVCTEAETASTVVPLIDASHSMAGIMEPLRAAVTRFVTSFRPDDQLTLLAFNQNLHGLAEAESDPEVLAGAVAQLSEIRGDTALYDSILGAVRQAGVALDTRRAVVVFTDGDERTSRATGEALVNALKGATTSVYVVLLRPDDAPRTVVRILENVASATGGRVFRIPRADRIDEAFSEISTAIRTAYTCHYEPNRPVNQDHHALTWTVEGRPDLFVSAPAGYGGDLPSVALQVEASDDPGTVGLARQRH